MPTQTKTRRRPWSPWRLAPGPITCTGCGNTIPLSGWVRGTPDGLRHQCGPCDGRPVAPGVQT